LSLLNIHGSMTSSSRRMANVQSLGYSDLFVLSKSDLWTTLEEFPDAKQRLIETGKRRLREVSKLNEVNCNAICYSTYALNP